MQKEIIQMKNRLSLIFITVLLLSACSPKTGPTPAGTTPPIINAEPPTSVPSQVPSLSPSNTMVPSVQVLSGEVEIDIEDLAFNPNAVTIKAGTTVKWGNKDNVTHNVISDDGSWSSNSLAKGDTFSFTFTQAGTFAYHCGVHPSMKATIIVVAP
jgi:plastocyanin